MENESGFRIAVDTSFGPMTVLWREHSTGPKVTRIVLSEEAGSLWRHHPHERWVRGSCPEIDALALMMTRFLEGDDVGFPLSIVDLDSCSRFQRRVLLEESRIPRGKVSTYGRIASRLGVPKGARAVGRALATNPFPLVIPCHRAVRNDGAIGGYQGGFDMKRRLLDMEGVRIDGKGRVNREHMV